MPEEIYSIDVSRSRRTWKNLSYNKAVVSIQEEIFSYLKDYDWDLPEELIDILGKCDTLKSISKLSTGEIHALFLYLEWILWLESTSENTSRRVNTLIELKKWNRWGYVCLASPEEKLLELKMKYLGLKHYVWTELYENRQSLAIALWEDLWILKHLKELDAQDFFALSDEQIIRFISFLKTNGHCLSKHRLSEFSL